MAAADAVALIGMPEGRINLAQAVIHLSLAPKSNAVVLAVDSALADVRAGLAGPVPPHLRDAHYGGAGKVGSGVGYVYPHDQPGGVAGQQYPPDVVVPKTYYRPTRHGAEARLAELWEKLRALVRAT